MKCQAFIVLTLNGFIPKALCPVFHIGAVNEKATGPSSIVIHTGMDRSHLIKRRKVLRTQATTVVNELQQLIATYPLPDRCDIDENCLRLREIDDALREVDNALAPLFTEQDYAKQFECEYKIRRTLFRANVFLTAKYSSSRASPTANTVAYPQNPNEAAAIPPHRTIHLPFKFDGQKGKWQLFWTRFESTIHNNVTLADGDKMNYLMAALEGQAVNAISGLQITAATYNTATSLLRDRFGNDSALVEDHLKSLADVEPVKSSRQVP
ncbi:uncharacterized protein LOC135369709 [Ornithodoros turicata]|uniref:uncharacterized protein LOC135369709 n=1 Tax=Ornithodoros turicata TaxID=34597 RepID=UPI003139779E